MSNARPGRGGLLGEKGLGLAMVLAILAVVVVPVVVVGTAFVGLSHPSSLVGWRWRPEGPHGLLQPLVGTVAIGAGVALVSGTLGVGTATWLRWNHSPRWASAVRLLLELSARVPSIVFAVLGVGLLVPTLERVVGVEDGTGGGATVGVLSIMALPRVVVRADRGLTRVSERHLHAAMSLGMSRAGAVYRAVWPLARPDLIVAVGAGVGCALGDTMVVLLLSGEPGSGKGLLGPVHTLAATLVRELPTAVDGSEHRVALYVMAALLFGIGCGLQGGIEWWRRRDAA